MFVELVILACLSGGPTCAEHRLLFDARDVSLMTCLAGAQPQVALWQEAHPLWRVERWSCGMTDPSRGEA
jgi:hypothetical protein